MSLIRLSFRCRSLLCMCFLCLFCSFVYNRMGIKELWSLLTPFCERKPLYELQGKTVAVDLSCWICEAQNVSEYSVQPRMYLRNLYFRTCYLLLMEVNPVFVLEGKAPMLKYQTIADRNAIQFKGAKPKSDKVKTGKDRSRFHFVLKQCEEMLRYMGLACITGMGEAESMCAYLNEDGLVEGCISQDSDCFAYGAKVVYRNFSISHQGSYAASGGAVDVYDIRKAYEFLKIGRNKIIALALLCGSDYNDGVHGVGKDSAMKFMSKYSDDEILPRMRLWCKNQSMFNELERKLSDKNLCTSCGHSGKIQSHTKIGCPLCGTTKGCDFTKFRDERLEIKNELQIRTKAIQDPTFPNEDLINEYLVRKDNIKTLDLKWKQPNLINFVKFTCKYLGWEEIYAFEKLMPILTRWQVLNFEFVADKAQRQSRSEIKGILYPNYIKKVRNPKGVQSYEIVWIDRYKYFDLLIPQEQLDEYFEHKNGNLEQLWSTIEPKHLVDKAYPSLVAEFLEKKQNKGKKPPKRPKKPKIPSDIDSITNQLQNTSITEPKPKRTRKKAQQKCDDLNPHKTTTNSNTLDTFVQKTRVEQLKQDENQKCSQSFDLNASNFSDEDAEFDVSTIIDGIVNSTPKLPEKIEKLGYRIQKSGNERCKHFEFTAKTVNNQSPRANEFDIFNASSFFQFNNNTNEQPDLFERTFEQLIAPVSNDENSGSDTENDSLFNDNYIPLLDRIKKNTLNA